MKNLYIGDSSDDEDIAYEPQKIVNGDLLLKVPYILTKLGQGLLATPSVREGYKQQKSDLRAKMIATGNVIEIDIDSDLLSCYLNYKKSKDLALEKRIEDQADRMRQHPFFENHKKLLFEEKTLYDSTVSPQLPQLITNLAQGLSSFILGIQFDNLEEVKDFFCIKDDTNKNFLIKLMTSPKYFSSRVIAMGKESDIAEYLIGKQDQKLSEFLTADSINRKKFNFIKDKTSKEFILFMSKQYAEGFCVEKSMIDIYLDVQKFNGRITIPDEILSYYREYINTNLVTVREQFIRNTDETKNSLYLTNFLLEILNLQNGKINSELIKYRPKEIFTKGFASNLENFLLEHRILRSKIKELGIKRISKDITCNKHLPIDQTDEKITIYPSGARSDLRFLQGSDSYEEIAKRLESLGIAPCDLAKHIKNIINGEALSKDALISHENTVYLYKVVDLLFNLETERNVSAFLTNIMFFELMERGTYTIKNLPDKLPMAMKGAVDASRLNQTLFPSPRKCHKFDFKTPDNDLYNRDQFNLKNLALMSDWLEMDSHGEIRTIADLMPTIHKVVMPYRGKRKENQLSEEDEKQQFQELLDQLHKCQCPSIKSIIVGATEGSTKIEYSDNDFKSTLYSKINDLIQSQCDAVNKQFIKNSIEIKTKLFQLIKNWYNLDLPCCLLTQAFSWEETKQPESFKINQSDDNHEIKNIGLSGEDSKLEQSSSHENLE